VEPVLKIQGENKKLDKLMQVKMKEAIMKKIKDK
jgi:hypothetical protein